MVDVKRHKDMANAFLGFAFFDATDPEEFPLKGRKIVNTATFQSEVADLEAKIAREGFYRAANPVCIAVREEDLVLPDNVSLSKVITGLAPTASFKKDADPDWGAYLLDGQKRQEVVNIRCRRIRAEMQHYEDDQQPETAKSLNKQLTLETKLMAAFFDLSKWLRRPPPIVTKIRPFRPNYALD